MLGTKLDVHPFLERVGQELLRIDPAEARNLADAIYYCYQHSRFVFLCGNGGSCSNASHFCEDLGKGTLRREDFDNDRRKRLRIISLVAARASRKVAVRLTWMTSSQSSSRS